MHTTMYAIKSIKVMLVTVKITHIQYKETMFTHIYDDTDMIVLNFKIVNVV